MLLAFFLFCVQSSPAQSLLQPGFNKGEYQELLQIFSQQYNYPDTPAKNKANPRRSGIVPKPQRYSLVYRSPEVGLRNRWDLWRRQDAKVAVISIHGTIRVTESWLENFYSAMVPAQGKLQLNDSTTFSYTLAADKKATIHVGWLLGLGHLAPSIMQQIKASHANGIKHFIIFGHSQGAAITYLLRNYLHYESQRGTIPADITFKTVCSAAPKPGNTYFVYDFDYVTRNGWGITVINPLDWVPETPFSVQRLSDFVGVNPFQDVSSTLKDQPFYVRWFVQGKFRKMRKRTENAQEVFEKNLGELMYKQVRKYLPQLKEPAYAPTNNYQRAGLPIILMPDEKYRKQFPDTTNNVFQHHMQDRYYILSQSYTP